MPNGVTDAVTQTNVKVLGEAPAQAMALVYQAASQSISLAMESAQNIQANLQQVGLASTSVAVTKIMQQI